MYQRAWRHLLPRRHSLSERRLDFIITGGVINGTPQFIIAGKNYKSYEDLRDATFGTASLTGGTITALGEALKVMGL